MVISGNGRNHVQGSGGLFTETRDVAVFHGVRLQGSGEATITVGEPQSLVIEAQENILPHLTTDVENGILVLGVEENTSITTDQGWTYTIAVESLDQLEILGSADADVSGLSGGSLSVTISGSGNITASGNVEAQAIVINGSGDYRALDLTSQVASVSVSGSGDAEVDVTDSLQVQISGSGNVIYRGDPGLSEEISGSGEVIKRRAN